MHEIMNDPFLKWMLYICVALLVIAVLPMIIKMIKSQSSKSEEEPRVKEKTDDETLIKEIAYGGVDHFASEAFRAVGKRIKTYGWDSPEMKETIRDIESLVLEMLHEKGFNVHSDLVCHKGGNRFEFTFIRDRESPSDRYTDRIIDVWFENGHFIYKNLSGTGTIREWVPPCPKKDESAQGEAAPDDVASKKEHNMSDTFRKIGEDIEANGWNNSDIISVTERSVALIFLEKGYNVIGDKASHILNGKFMLAYFANSGNESEDTKTATVIVHYKDGHFLYQVEENGEVEEWIPNVEEAQ